MWGKGLPICLCGCLVLCDFHLEGEEKTRAKSKKKSPKEKQNPTIPSSSSPLQWLLIVLRIKTKFFPTVVMVLCGLAPATMPAFSVTKFWHY